MAGLSDISRSFGIHATKPNFSATMKVIIVAFAFVALVASLPVDKEPVKILRFESEIQPDGSYNFGYETEDGSFRNENGVLKEAFDEENKPHSVIVVKGTYTYTNSEGQPETINYFADETGYHAEGKSIPQPVEPISRR